MTGRRLSLILIVAALACPGCASTDLRLQAREQSIPSLPGETAAYYDYPSHIHQATSILLRKSSKHSEYLIRFPLSVPDGLETTEPIVEIEWFENHKPGRQPAILFNPILGGDYPIERALCRSLAAAGFHVALVHRKTLKVSPEHDIGQLEVLLRQGVLRIRQAVDWMSVQPSVDAGRMGSYGISMGGIASALAAAVEPRLKAHVVALAGGNIPDILLTSHDKLLVKPLALYLSRNKIERSVLEEQVRESVKTDPIALASYVNPKQIILYVALFDRTIGRGNALRLRKELGFPQTVFLPLGHYTAYLTLPYLKYSSIRFLKKQLGSGTDPF